MVGSRTDIVVAMDWTDYGADGQATLALKLVTRRGRATPLVWLSVHKDELVEARNDCEDVCLRRLAEVLPDGVRATILADRGFPATRSGPSHPGAAMAGTMETDRIHPAGMLKRIATPAGATIRTRSGSYWPAARSAAIPGRDPKDRHAEMRRRTCSASCR
jgi:hypothetical protein